MSAPVLEVTDLHKSYVRHLLGGRRQEVLRGVDLAVSPGEFVVLTGPSGCGKSTLLRCVNRSALADRGSIRLRVDGRDLDLAAAPDLEVLAARRAGVGMATQFLSVVPRVGASELLQQEGLSAAQAEALLDQLGLPRELHDVPPATYSGGQRQLMNVALALARRRPLLLLDEATSALDTMRRRVVLKALRERKREGAAMLAVFHDPPDIAGLVDRVVRLEAGRVVAA